MKPTSTIPFLDLYAGNRRHEAAFFLELKVLYRRSAFIGGASVQRFETEFARAVAAELVGANSGLGFLINDARSMLRTDIITVGMLTIGIVCLAIDATIRALTRRALPWSLGMAK